MRSLVARLAVMGAFAISVSACGGGNGNSLPFAGPPNNGGGNGGTIQTGSNGIALLRYINGSPDAGNVDVCVDNIPFGITSPVAAYAVPKGLYAVAGGIAHVVSIYPSLGPTNPNGTSGSECATAPGPYFGVSPLAVTTISPAVNARQTIVLAGNVKTTPSTLTTYVFTEPSFVVVPGSPETITHNAAAAFSVAPHPTVGFGICTTTVTPCAVAVALAGATNELPGKAPVVSPLAAIPPGFYDGAGVAAGTPVPITSITAPSAGGQPYALEMFAIDAPAGGLNLIAYVEQTVGYGF